MLTDRGSCFTAEGFEKLCRARGVEHRKTRPYTPRTNGTVERCNGRVQREVLGLTVASHRDLERLLKGFNAAYNARRQRVLGGRSPAQVVRERLRHNESLANPAYRPPADLRPAQGHAGHRARQGRLAARHLGLGARIRLRAENLERLRDRYQHRWPSLGRRSWPA